MANLSLQDLLVIGSGSATYVPATAVTGDRAYNPMSNTRIWVQNAGAATTVDFISQRSSNFGSFPDKTLSIPAFTFYPIPAMDARRFNDAADWVKFIFADATNITIAAVADVKIYKD